MKIVSNDFGTITIYPFIKHNDRVQPFDKGVVLVTVDGSIYLKWDTHLSLTEKETVEVAAALLAAADVVK